ENLHFHLPNDFVTMPGMNASIWEFGNAQPKPFDIVHAVRSSFVEKTILAEAAYKRVAPERNTHGSMRVEVDCFENESLGLHSLVRLKVCVIPSRVRLGCTVCY